MQQACSRPDAERRPDIADVELALLSRETIEEDDDGSRLVFGRADSVDQFPGRFSSWFGVPDRRTTCMLRGS